MLRRLWLWLVGAPRSRNYFDECNASERLKEILATRSGCERQTALQEYARYLVRIFDLSAHEPFAKGEFRCSGELLYWLIADRIHLAYELRHLVLTVEAGDPDEIRRELSMARKMLDHAHYPEPGEGNLDDDTYYKRTDPNAEA